MVYYITGSNIFGQWCGDDNVINEFREFTTTKHNLNRGSLIQINWSYNVFEVDNVFFITGAFDGKEKQVIEIPIPEECIDLNADLSVIGNDYKIILIGKNLNTLWVIDLKEKNEVKKIKVNVEEPLETRAKKQKIDNNLIKAVISNDSCLYLTSNGSVYSGLLPSYVDTIHCKGKVIDIQCGYEHYVLLTDQGRVYTWGNGRRLQLGHGDIANQEIPTEVEALAGIIITKISAGGWHSLALSTFGDVYAWGWNDTGQLGIKNINKEQESYSIPTVIDLYDEGEGVVTNAKDIACGSRHSAILLDDNTVWTTGCNKYGQLGLSEEKYPSVHSFKKTFCCAGDSLLKCGLWNTVIHNINR